MIEFLEQEDLLTRQPYGPISEVRWRQLLMRWSEDYGLAQTNPVQTYLEPRGLGALTDHLREAGDLQYALTGSLAAERFAPYAPPRLAMLYVEDPSGPSLRSACARRRPGPTSRWPPPSTASSSTAARRSTDCRSRRPPRSPSTCSPVPGATPVRRPRCSTGWRPMSPPGDAELLIAARGALLDALDALAAHRDALVVIGAQAVYLHTGAADVALAEATKDSDVAIDPREARRRPADRRGDDPR